VDKNGSAKCVSTSLKSEKWACAGFSKLFFPFGLRFYAKNCQMAITMTAEMASVCPSTNTAKTASSCPIVTYNSRNGSIVSKYYEDVNS